ncbi:MAG: hypothetical protein AAB953_03740 [Patescibacteria group bacterium]
MKKFLVILAMLSMTALLFTACNKGDEVTEETTPAAEEATVVPAPVVEAPAAEVPAAEVK